MQELIRHSSHVQYIPLHPTFTPSKRDQPYHHACYACFWPHAQLRPTPYSALALILRLTDYDPLTPNMAKEFQDKVVLITGAASGIGYISISILPYSLTSPVRI
jgi:hypothetical protein